ncbi:hypothetical protein H696_00252 [Fonticula alba]|uniref:Uncharacterized protein n=1 Tax=Fonticula alba TaxID=691883 RepID=A0A058ZGQ1_FONAL|nr:hypothetical protein H696_00252 [Fonticula alba]KCV72672.1 hypothetical protein H696_00252 [Fonticula alba]|eukprot:XP_009492373.1 hypothetical protein H696_00252 [Fonticula alba]
MLPVNRRRRSGTSVWTPISRLPSAFDDMDDVAGMRKAPGRTSARTGGSSPSMVHASHSRAEDAILAGPRRSCSARSLRLRIPSSRCRGERKVAAVWRRSSCSRNERAGEALGLMWALAAARAASVGQASPGGKRARAARGKSPEAGVASLRESEMALSTARYMDEAKSDTRLITTGSRPGSRASRIGRGVGAAGSLAEDGTKSPMDWTLGWAGHSAISSVAGGSVTAGWATTGSAVAGSAVAGSAVAGSGVAGSGVAGSAVVCLGRRAPDGCIGAGSSEARPSSGRSISPSKRRASRIWGISITTLVRLKGSGGGQEDASSGTSSTGVMRGRRCWSSATEKSMVSRSSM